MTIHNEDNLIPFNERSKEETRELGKKGGKASGEARRRKKLLAEQMKMLLELPLKNAKLKEEIKKLGISEEDVDNQMALTISIYQQAMKGNVKAYEVIRDTIGEKPQENINLSGEVNNPYSSLSEEELRKLAGE